MLNKEQWYEDYRTSKMNESIIPRDLFIAGFELGKEKAAEFVEQFVDEGDLAPQAIRKIGDDKCI